MDYISPYIWLSLSLFVIILIGMLLLVIIDKSEKNNKLRNSLNQLKNSFNDLDEQAKLIVKTDLDLNKAQEELDKRLGGLDALQKISRLISTTLDEEEIFTRLQQTLTATLNFEKNLILVYDEEKSLHCRVALGFPEESIPTIVADLEKDSGMITSFNDGYTFSSINSPKPRREYINQLLGVEHFVFTPILSQKGIIGLVFVGNQSNAAGITKGDEELISILASQIGQTLENARLFEQVFRSRQILEAKVRDRTNQLESALKEVQDISKTKSEFISAVSHELRTPLTSIKGYASILMAGKLGDVPEQVRERLGKINTHSDNLVKMINDLLDISRIESGRVEMNLSKCSLAEIIDNVHDLLTPQMKEKNIQWVAEVGRDIPEMMLDSSQTERIFINLIGNAVKFTPQHGTISVKAHLNDGVVTVEVSDTGIGISEENISKLFAEFYRIDNQINQNVKGTGLGLALAKKIVEAHKGRIWITSKLNQGTTFHFTLPVNQSSPGSISDGQKTERP
ncbi:MAG: GAF domain-containing sensor histidine kinase [Candidatus Omnitrophica bacterium]|nr:GAF domain-containing sensor histidine kinase [Candidatus Omnitrophota bacterium]